MIPTIANGQPAAVAYQRDRDGKLHAFGLGVLSVTDAGIARIFVFGGGPNLIATFGLPAVHHGTRGLQSLPGTNG
jgi:RNA polymerase sigma-70 factor, ECF subfamily